MSNWSLQERAILEAYYPVLPIDEIARRIPGRTIDAIYAMAASMKLTRTYMIVRLPAKKREEKLNRLKEEMAELLQCCITMPIDDPEFKTKAEEYKRKKEEKNHLEAQENLRKYKFKK